MFKDIISMKLFTTCPTTGFIYAKNILKQYNDTNVIKKELKFLNQYIVSPEFFSSGYNKMIVTLMNTSPLEPKKVNRYPPPPRTAVLYEIHCI